MEDSLRENQSKVVDTHSTTLAQRLCARVLSCVHEVDDCASISTVSKWDHDDATLVRIKSGISGSAQPLALLRALKTKFPLARVTTVENCIDGSTEAQILLPSSREQHAIAESIASGSQLNVWLRHVFHGLLFTFVVTFAIRVAVDASR